MVSATRATLVFDGEFAICRLLGELSGYSSRMVAWVTVHSVMWGYSERRPCLSCCFDASSFSPLCPPHHS